MITRDQLEQLFAQYGWPMDTKDWTNLNTVFTADSKFTVQIAGGDTYGPIEGRAAIYEFVSQTVGAQTDQRRHVITNGSIELKSSGLYRGEVVQEDGQWRFSSLHLYLDVPF